MAPAANDPGAKTPKRALITGGGSGQGLAMTRRLMARDVWVFICGHDQRILDEARQQLVEETGGTCIAREVNLMDGEQPAEIVSTCVEQLGGIDILINNAGIWEPAEWGTMTAESWDRSVNLMARAPLLSMQAAAPHMARSGGRIINNSSISAALSEPVNAPYSAAKAALVSLTESAAVDLAPLGIRVNALAPGWIRSAMSEEYLGTLSPKEISKLNPIGRPGDPDEVAAIAEFLALDAPDYLTGQTIFVDGGQHVLLVQPEPGS